MAAEVDVNLARRLKMKMLYCPVPSYVRSLFRDPLLFPKQKGKKKCFTYIYCVWVCMNVWVNVLQVFIFSGSEVQPSGRLESTDVRLVKPQSGAKLSERMLSIQCCLMWDWSSRNYGSTVRMTPDVKLQQLIKKTKKL